MHVEIRPARSPLVLFPAVEAWQALACRPDQEILLLIYREDELLLMSHVTGWILLLS